MISADTLKDIAGELDMGMLCFYHKTTGAVESYPNEAEGFLSDDEESPWQDVIRKIEKNPDRYIKIEPMTSRESYQVMESFVEAISDAATKNAFADAISRKKPFRQFEEMLARFSGLRDQWFAYKDEAYIQYVKKSLS